LASDEEKKSLRQKLAEKIYKPKEPDFRDKTLQGLGVSVLSDQKLENRIALLITFQDKLFADIETSDLPKYVETLEDRLNQLNMAITEIASPYAAMGTYPLYTKKYNAWLFENSMAKSWILQVKEIIGYEESKQTEKTNAKQEKTIIALASLAESLKALRSPEDQLNDTLEKIDNILNRLNPTETEDMPQNITNFGLIDNRMLVRFLHDGIQKIMFVGGFSFLGQCFRDKHVSERAAIVIQTMHEKRYVPMGQEGTTT